MTSILTASPGQQVTIVFEQLIADGYRADGYNTTLGGPDGYGLDGYYTLPIVERIFFPNMTQAAGYPQKMVYVDTGLYYFHFTLPTGATAIGTYIVDLKYVNPVGLNIAQASYQVIVSAPFGMYSVGTF